MTEYSYTEYFEKEVLRKRSYLKKEWCIRVIENPLRVESQRPVAQIAYNVFVAKFHRKK
jgi:hypothetical protein